MTILYHHRTLADGAEGIHIAEMIAAFRDLGHHVVLRGLAGSEGRQPRERLVHGLKRMLPPAGFELASLASNGPDCLAVRRAVRTTTPDFVYKRHARHDLGALVASRRAGIPAVLEVNCLFTSPQYTQFEPISLDALARWSERRALTLADIVVAVSTPLAREIERMYQVKAVVLPNGANPHRFDPAKAQGDRIRAQFALGSGLVVGWAGMLRKWHGLEVLLEALSALSDARLLIVGDGPERSDVERKAAACGLQGRLVITGRVPREDMPHYLAAMDMAVVASDKTGVASPMKLLEYMAMERAVVAPRLDNIQDIVTDQRDGLLFTPGSVAELRDTLQQLAQDEPLRRALGQAARRTVLSTRNWRCNAERVLALVGQRVHRSR